MLWCNFANWQAVASRLFMASFPVMFYLASRDIAAVNVKTNDDMPVYTVAFFVVGFSGYYRFPLKRVTII
jgi:hypothetical protein